MSSYATTSDLTRFCREKVLASFTADQQQAALDAASSLADGYLRAQYTLPISGDPTADLVRAVCNVAAYDLITQRGYNPEAGADANWRLRYEDAVRWLEGVSRGTISPMLAGSGVVDPLTGQAGLSDTGAPIVINPPSQRGWR